jgi:hypothetical protein
VADSDGRCALCLLLMQVLQTEKQMYQDLIARVRANLATTVAAIDGVEPMTEEVQTCINSLYYNRVPLAWHGMARGIDCSNLNAWTADLDRRLIFMRQWIRDGAPITMPLGMLLAPNVFLASLLQVSPAPHPHRAPSGGTALFVFNNCRPITVAHILPLFPAMKFVLTSSILGCSPARWLLCRFFFRSSLVLM